MQGRQARPPFTARRGGGDQVRVHGFCATIDDIDVSISVTDRVATGWELGHDATAGTVRAQAVKLASALLRERKAVPGDRWTVLFIDHGVVTVTQR